MTPESDRELEELLAATAAGRQRLRAESAAEVPPPHVDAAILAAARRAVSARPTLVGRSPWRRWQVPLAAAAVLVVATSLSLMVDRGSEPGLPIQPHLDFPSASPPAAPEYRTPPSTAQDAVAARRTDPRARVQEPASKDSAGAGSAENEMAPAELRDVPKSKVANRAEAPAPTVRGAELEATSAADLAEAKPEIQNQVLGPPPAAPAPAQPASAKQELRQARESMAPKERDSAAGSADSGAPPAPPAPPAPAASAPAKAMAPASLAKRRLKLSSEEVLRYAEREPERALAAIREVWDDGQHESARAMLADFLQKQPGYPLPPDYPVPRPAADQLKERSPEGR